MFCKVCVQYNFGSAVLWSLVYDRGDGFIREDVVVTHSGGQELGCIAFIVLVGYLSV